MVKKDKKEGKSGKICEKNKAEYILVEYSNIFIIISGGGGGYSESNKEGSDAKNDGKGLFNRKGKTRYNGILEGNTLN